MIFVFDRHLIMQGVLTNGSPDACPYYNDEHVEQLEDGISTYSFDAPSDKSVSEHIIAENYIAFRDLDGFLTLYQIKEVTTKQESGQHLLSVISESTAVGDLLGEIIRPQDLNGYTAEQMAETLLQNTLWKVGNVEWLGVKSLSFQDYPTALAALREMAQAFEGELRFRVTMEGNKITGRYIDLLERRGSETGKQFEYEKDIIGLRRTEDSTGLVTALIGLGAADSNGNRLTFKSAVWNKASHGVDKPSGQDWIGDDAALARWGKDGKHIVGVHESDAENAYSLMEETWKELKSRNKPRLTYEVDVVLLERIAGLSHESVRIGDTVQVIDLSFNPALILDARVIELRRSYTDPTRDAAILGEFAPTFIDNASIAKQLSDLLTRKSGPWDASIIYKSAVKPSITVQDTLWLDTSKSPNVLMRYEESAGDYVKAGVDAPSDIGAPTTDEALEMADEKAQHYAGIAEGRAVEAAETNATLQAQAAEQAAKAHADAAAAAERVKAEAYADGIVTAEEEARIADANAKLAAAKSYAEQKALDAQEAAVAEAKLDAASKAETAEQAAIDAAILEVQASETRAKAHADGIVSDEEQARINAVNKAVSDAKADATAKANAAETAALNAAKLDAQAKANAAESAAKAHAEAKASAAQTAAEVYADGVVTAEEEARLQQATANLNAAKAHAEDTAAAAETAAKTFATAEAQEKADAALAAAKADSKAKIDAAQAAAEEYAEAQAALAEASAKAYADGIITDEEAASLANLEQELQDARDYADQQAKAAMDYVDKIALVDDVPLGGIFDGSFTKNVNSSGTNAGEIKVEAGSGKFYHPNGSEYTVENDRYIFTSLEGTELEWAYLMFVGSDKTRFAYPYSSSSEEFLAVWYRSGVWEYNDNNVFTPFEPNENDAIVGKITEGPIGVQTLITYYSRNAETTAGARAKAAEAQAAAIAAANAETALAETRAKAHADGIVSAEEQARIDQAEENLAAAKADAQTKATAAKNAAISAAAADAESKADAAKAAAITAAKAETALAEARAKAHADGIVSDEEQARINQAAANLAAAKADAQAKANAAKDAAISAASSDAKSKADAAKAAAITAANAETALAETRAKAHADGIVSDEEEARIQQAADNLAAAKSDAQSKANAAKTAAINAAALDAQSKANAAKAAAITAANAETALAEARAKAYADGVVSDEEQARIDQAAANLAAAKADAQTKADAAKAAAIAAASTDATNKANVAKAAAQSYAQSQASYAQTQAEAYADGVVSAEEQTRINQAANNLAEAKQHADLAAQAAEDAAVEYANISISSLYDPYFEQGGKLWSIDSYGETVPELVYGTVVQGEGTRGGKVWQNTGQSWIYAKNPIPVDTSRTYEITFRVRQTVDPTSGDSRVYAGAVTLGANYQGLTGGAGTHRYAATGGSKITKADGWVTFTGRITGEGDTHQNFRPGTAYVRPMFIINYSGGNGTAQVDLLEFKDVTDEVNAKAYAEAKASDAQSAAQGYAKAQAELAQTTAEAYADGQVSAEEQARINQAASNLAAAKAHADSKAAAAESAAKTYADTAAEEAEAAARAYAAAQAAAERVKAEAYADGVISDEEQARINDVNAKLATAKSYAESKAAAAETAAKSHADTKAGTAESNAKSYANTRANQAESNAKNAVANGEVNIPLSKAIGDFKIESGKRIMADSNFYWDQWGLLLRNPSNANHIVRLSATGIAISKNGGYNYDTAITSEGVIGDRIVGNKITGILLEGVNIETQENIKVGRDLYLGDFDSFSQKNIYFNENSGNSINGGHGPYDSDLQLNGYEVQLNGSGNGIELGTRYNYDTYEYVETGAFRDGQFELPYNSQASAQLTSNYTPVSYTFDKIPFNKVYVDNHTEFSTSAGRFYVKKPGTYLVDFSLRCMNVPNGWNIAASVYRNGSEYARPYQSTGTGNTEHAHGVAVCYNLDAGDYLDIRLYNSTASPALYVQAATTQTYFKVWRLG
jgi:phage minor structural protein